MANVEAQTCQFRRVTKRSNLRKRCLTDSGDDSCDENFSTLDSNKSQFGNRAAGYKPRPPPGHRLTSTSRKSTSHHTADSSDDSGDESTNMASSDDVTRSRMALVTDLAYKSTGDCAQTGPADMGATSQVQIHTESDRDARAVAERARAQGYNRPGERCVKDDKLYRGRNNYINYNCTSRDSEHVAPSQSRGPIRAPSNIRSTVRWDYKPDICKDYKETGFCGFGDSCIFMHDRTDYKFGWQLEREMERQTYGAGDEEDYRVSSDGDEDHTDEAGGKQRRLGRHVLPFRCFICRDSFRDPVVTQCGHYFCQQCALAEYRKSTRCYICNAQTNGVFNVATRIVQRLGKKGAGCKRSTEDGSSSDEDL